MTDRQHRPPADDVHPRGPGPEDVVLHARRRHPRGDRRGLQRDRNEVLGLVGESGCGKSVTSLSILGLVSEPGKVEGGEVIFDGQDLLTLSD